MNEKTSVGKRLKRWPFLILGLVLLVIMISAGQFAFTTLTGTATVTITGGGTEFATITSAGYTWSSKPIGDKTGSVETGNLFSVTRDSDYTGDLVLTLSLTNSDELTGQYNFLNLKIEVLDSAATPEVVDSDWLTLIDTIEEFVIPAAKISPFTVKISDGSYRVQKGVNPTTSPIFHIRSKQR